MPRLLDLFCGAGGASMGYHLAGFEVVGVDLKPQPRYPFEFIQANALDFPLDGFDVIHASPPCHAYTILQRAATVKYPDLVGQTRAKLTGSGTPWIIENVSGAPLLHGVVLCGGAFGLGATGIDGRFRPLRRHRLFESSEPLLAPPCHCDGREKLGVYGSSDGGSRKRGKDSTVRGGYQGTTKERREAMGIHWMNREELSLAIPPAYTRYLGRQLLQSLAEIGGADEQQAGDEQGRPARVGEHHEVSESEADAEAAGRSF